MKSVVELLVSRESNENISDYCIRYERKIHNPKQKGSFHSTVYFSNKYPLFSSEKLRDEINSRLPIELDPKTYFWDIFGECLVLRYDNKLVKKIHETLLSEVKRQQTKIWSNLNEFENDILNRFFMQGERAVYPEFSPHITLSKKFDKEKLDKLVLFQREIILDNITFKFIK